MKKKGFTLIEIIVVIVILSILLAIAVPSVMSYMNSANKAKYYAASRSVTQKINVELSKLYAGDSDAKNYNSAVKAALNSYNKSVTGDTYVYATTVHSSINNTPNNIHIGRDYDGKTDPPKEYAPENIKFITLYFTNSLNNINPTCYCYVYPNKKIVYHSM